MEVRLPCAARTFEKGKLTQCTVLFCFQKARVRTKLSKANSVSRALLLSDIALFALLVSRYEPLGLRSCHISAYSWVVPTSFGAVKRFLSFSILLMFLVLPFCCAMLFAMTSTLSPSLPSCHCLVHYVSSLGLTRSHRILFLFQYLHVQKRFVPRQLLLISGTLCFDSFRSTAKSSFEPKGCEQCCRETES